MKKVIVIILCIVVGCTLFFKLDVFKDAKVFVLNKINVVFKGVYKVKNLGQTKEHLLNIIDEYERKLDEYAVMAYKYDLLTKENNELRSLMNLNDESYSIIYADIMEKSLVYDYVIINKGKNSGIKEGSAVICSTSFIGIVKEVSNNSSTISLINGMEYPVMNASSFEMGAIKEYKDGYYMVKDIKGDINIGDAIVTGKYQIDIPSGLLIGIVEEVSDDEFGLSKILKVKSGYEYNSINSVGVMVK